MKIVISTHQGVLYNDIVDYVVVKNKDGEFAIMKDHVAVICVIEEGYVKLVLNENEAYVALANAVLEYNHNEVSVLAQEAHIGYTCESAKAHLDEIRNQSLEANRKQSSDFTKMEKELRDNLKKVKAGSL